MGQGKKPIKYKQTMANYRYGWKGSEVPHIISIRLADTDEKRLYYGERDLQATGWYRVNP